MNRRTFLTTISSVGVVSIAGCIRNEDNSQEETQIVNHTFELIEADDVSQTDIKQVGDDEIAITGSVDVKDGCQSIELVDDPYIVGNNPVTAEVSIKSYREADEDAMCTQAIKTVGYRLTITYDGPDIQYVSLSLSGVESKEVELPITVTYQSED